MKCPHRLSKNELSRVVVRVQWRTSSCLPKRFKNASNYGDVAHDNTQNTRNLLVQTKQQTQKRSNKKQPEHAPATAWKKSAATALCVAPVFIIFDCQVPRATGSVLSHKPETCRRGRRKLGSHSKIWSYLGSTCSANRGRVAQGPRASAGGFP